ncbi:MAG: class I SAM-dependent methyltransferase [Magnetococcales bacterium]|nr:class I SAM-dependent methyltransferase [Magnetococcales bacterium]
MRPNVRGMERFLRRLADDCPIGQLSHLYLSHWPADFPSPLDHLIPSGFNGTVVAGRVSITKRFRQQYPSLTIQLHDHPTAHTPANHILLELPPGREAARSLVESALASLGQTGRLWIFGSRESGIEGIGKRFSEAATETYRGHVRLLSLGRESVFTPAPGKPVSAPALDDEGFHRIQAAGVELASRPGVFSWQELDPASRLLLESLPENLTGQLLDWGCGSGVLGLSLARRHPGLQVVMSDDQISAVRSCERGIQLNGLERSCRVIAEDGVGHLLEGMTFSHILANPPRHRGEAPDQSATQQFIPAAAKRLQPGGGMWLVGNRFWDLGWMMADCLDQVEVVADTEGFRVWRGVKGRAASRSRKKS